MACEVDGCGEIKITSKTTLTLALFASLRVDSRLYLGRFAVDLPQRDGLWQWAGGVLEEFADRLEHGVSHGQTHVDPVMTRGDQTSRGVKILEEGSCGFIEDKESGYGSLACFLNALSRSGVGGKEPGSFVEESQSSLFVEVGWKAVFQFSQKIRKAVGQVMAFLPDLNQAIVGHSFDNCLFPDPQEQAFESVGSSHRHSTSVRMKLHLARQKTGRRASGPHEQGQHSAREPNRELGAAHDEGQPPILDRVNPFLEGVIPSVPFIDDASEPIIDTVDDVVQAPGERLRAMAQFMSYDCGELSRVEAGDQGQAQIEHQVVAEETQPTPSEPGAGVKVAIQIDPVREGNT
jgi:hypothetical protein